MNRYRAVIITAAVIEFDNPGSMKHVENQARQLAKQYDAIESRAGRGVPYEPTLAEIAIVSGNVLVDQIPEIPLPMSA